MAKKDMKQFLLIISKDVDQWRREWDSYYDAALNTRCTPEKPLNTDEFIEMLSNKYSHWIINNVDTIINIANANNTSSDGKAV